MATEVTEIETTKESLPVADPWRYTKSNAVADLVDKLTAEALAVMPAQRRTNATKDNIRAIVEVMGVGNMLHWSERDHAGMRVFMSNKLLGRQWVYSAPVLSRNLPDTLKALEAIGIVYLLLGESERQGDTYEWEDGAVVEHLDRMTEVRPTPRLLSLFRSLQLTSETHTFRRGGECLALLKADKEFRKDDSSTVCGLVDYSDSRRTKALQREVRLINKHLLAHDYTYTGTEQVDVRALELRRVFTKGDTSFRSGGRYAGATGVQPWWYPLDKDDRLLHINIDGEAMADLDFSGMYVQLAYARRRLGLPAMADLYGVALNMPPSDELRVLVKQVYSACLFHDADGKALAQWPRAIQAERKAAAKRGEGFPEVSCGQIVSALLQLHRKRPVWAG